LRLNPIGNNDGQDRKRQDKQDSASLPFLIENECDIAGILFILPLAILHILFDTKFIIVTVR